MWRHERAIAAVIALCVVAFFSLAAERTDPTVARDSWFCVSIGGSDCGWMHEQIKVEGSRIHTTNDMALTLGRAGSQVTVRVAWKFVEDPDGNPIECETQQISGAEVSRTTYHFLDKEIEVQENAGGRILKRKIPRPEGEWWTPARIERNLLALRTSGGVEISYRTVDPASGLRVVDMVSKRSGAGEAKTVRWTTTNSAVAIPTEEDVDSKGQVVMSRTNMAIGDMVVRLCSETQARKAPTGGGVDVIGRSMVLLPKPAPELLRGKRSRLAVRSTDSQSLSLPASGAQRTQANPAGGLFVDVEVGRTSAATAEELADARFVVSSIFIDANDPAVQALAQRALKAANLADDAPVMQRAEALRAFVVRFIVHKDLATAFAGASAVAQSKSGDCSEHAVLLAALLRAQGIPSRVASGLIYAEEFGAKRNVFAWHMWTQALIAGAWVDLDATLYGRSFHPGHILIATSAQDDAQLDADFSGLLTTIGAVSIEVVHVD